ncbi:hypothetical protein BHE74_00024433 [Ensete ventricosum]|nr:hypothetical protein BHE74_00024433 [Ensete ventricosum]
MSTLHGSTSSSFLPTTASFSATPHYCLCVDATPLYLLFVPSTIILSKEAVERGDTDAKASPTSSFSSSATPFYLLFVFTNHHIVRCDAALPPLCRCCTALPHLHSRRPPHRQKRKRRQSDVAPMQIPHLPPLPSPTLHRSASSSVSSTTA